MSSSRDEKLAHLTELVEDSVVLRRSMMQRLGKDLIDAAAVISGVFGSGGKVLVAGNGGSAAQASHFAAEMVVRLAADRNREALAVVALAVDPAVVTAAANDFRFDNVFSRQVEAIGNKGDMLLVLSTSGNSPNLINAVRAARERGLLTLALLGGRGGKLAKLVDRALIVPHPSTQRIQEEHLLLIHALVELVEGDLFS